MLYQYVNIDMHCRAAYIIKFYIKLLSVITAAGINYRII